MLRKRRPVSQRSPRGTRLRQRGIGASVQSRTSKSDGPDRGMFLRGPGRSCHTDQTSPNVGRPHVTSRRRDARAHARSHLKRAAGTYFTPGGTRRTSSIPPSTSASWGRATRLVRLARRSSAGEACQRLGAGDRSNRTEASGRRNPKGGSRRSDVRAVGGWFQPTAFRKKRP
jgi:hypothetical protein